jgi:hypothetical protein
MSRKRLQEPRTLAGNNQITVTIKSRMFQQKLMLKDSEKKRDKKAPVSPTKS